MRRSYPFPPPGTKRQHPDRDGGVEDKRSLRLHFQSDPNGSIIGASKIARDIERKTRKRGCSPRSFRVARKNPLRFLQCQLISVEDVAGSQSARRDEFVESGAFDKFHSDKIRILVAGVIGRYLGCPCKRNTLRDPAIEANGFGADAWIWPSHPSSPSGCASKRSCPDGRRSGPEYTSLTFTRFSSYHWLHLRLSYIPPLRVDP
jgi:hypothetical protein